MEVIKNENTEFYDVDGTLIVHEPIKNMLPGHRVDVLDPVTKKFIAVSMNKPMIRLLRESAHRGSFVFVWSKGGHEWAANVIKALGLTNEVDMVISKPTAYFDDTPIEQWLPYRVFIGPTVTYKDQKTN